MSSKGCQFFPLQIPYTLHMVLLINFSLVSAMSPIMAKVSDTLIKTWGTDRSVTSYWKEGRTIK